MDTLPTPLASVALACSPFPSSPLLSVSLPRLSPSLPSSPPFSPFPVPNPSAPLTLSHPSPLTGVRMPWIALPGLRIEQHLSLTLSQGSSLPRVVGMCPASLSEAVLYISFVCTSSNAVHHVCPYIEQCCTSGLSIHRAMLFITLSLHPAMLHITLTCA